MSLIVRNVLAVIGGLAVGTVVKMALVMLNAFMLFPMPAGADMHDAEQRKAYVATRDPAQISEADLNQCSECEGPNFTPWDEHRPGPRCKGRMKVDPAGPTTLWD
jgi:hypothetical protein